MKLLGINLTKYYHHPYIENYKKLMKKLKGDLSKWRYITCSCNGRLITAGGLTVPDFSAFYKVTLMKEIWY